MIQLADIFNPGMTLQRQTAIAIWGQTSHAQQIQVYLDERLLADGEFPEGPFRLLLPPQEAGEDLTLKVVGSSGDLLVLTKVDIGEVWIAGGQSNMAFPMLFEQHYEAEVAQAYDPHVRFYDVPKYAFEGEEADGFKNHYGFGVWRSCSQTDLQYFSAVGYYFAKQLKAQLHVPVAIVGCNWGGTTAATWLDEALLKEDAILKVYWDEYQTGLQKINQASYDMTDLKARKFEINPVYRWLMHRLYKGNNSPLFLSVVERLSGSVTVPIGPKSQNRPGGLYKNMVEKIVGFSCRGVIWYQGETDDDKADLYASLFTKVIECWRHDWRAELPFIFVQLAPFGTWLGGNGSKFPAIRAQQEIVSKAVANTAMASIMDVGMEKDIHPKNKKTVGERLALLARGKVYGEDILCEPPEAFHATLQDDTIEIRFLNSGDGLQITSNAVQAVQVFSKDKKVCHIRQVTAQADCLLLQSEDFIDAEPLTIHFADVGYCEVNLFNSIGLPAKPFILIVTHHEPLMNTQ